MILALTATLILLQTGSPTTDVTPDVGPAPTPAAAPGAPASAPVARPAPERPQRVDAPGIEGTPVRVERRQLVKARKSIFAVGAAYYLRGDYFITPGLQASYSHYLDERSGFELRGGFFVPFLTPAAQGVFDDLGFVPDVPRALASIQAGYRRSLGYGKVLVFGTADSLVHFDLQLVGHVGGVVSDRGFGPSLSFGPALIARIGPSWTFQLDVPITASLEPAEFPVVLGLLPIGTVGYAF